MIFYIMMYMKFTIKDIFVSEIHTSAPPSSITYSGVVSREIVTILFLLASINYL